MANDDNNWGTHLRAIRTGKGLTQAQLADLVGVSRQTVNYIEQGTYCPSTKLALLISRAVDTPLDALFFLKEEEV